MITTSSTPSGLPMGFHVGQGYSVRPFLKYVKNKQSLGTTVSLAQAGPMSEDAVNYGSLQPYMRGFYVTDGNALLMGIPRTEATLSLLCCCG